MHRFLFAVVALCLALPSLATPLNNFNSDVALASNAASSVSFGYFCNNINQCVDGNGTVCVNPGWCKFDNFIGSPCACPHASDARTPPKLDGWYCTSNLTCEYQTVNNGSATPNAAGVPRECWTRRCSAISNVGQSCQCPLPSDTTAAPAKPTGSAIVQPLLPVSQFPAHPTEDPANASKGYTCKNTICYAGNDTARPLKCLDSRCFKLKSDGIPCGCSRGSDYNPLPVPTYNKTSIVSAHPTATRSVSGVPYGNTTFVQPTYSTSGRHPHGSRTMTHSHSTTGAAHGNHTVAQGPYATLTRPGPPINTVHTVPTSSKPGSADISYSPHIPIPVNSPHVVHNTTQTVATSTTAAFSGSGSHHGPTPHTRPFPIIPPYNLDNKHHNVIEARDNDNDNANTDGKKEPCPSPKLNPNPPFNFICPGDDKYCLNPVISDKPPFAFVCPP